MRLSSAQRGYGQKWQEARAVYLRVNPWCAYCAAQGKRTPATVVDHKIPHRGDQKLFWRRSNWQPLCALHHDSSKRHEEKTGRIAGCGKDGVPTDPRHWWNGGTRTITVGSIPAGLRPSLVPLTIVCGPPASGKTRWVAEHASPGDLVIDLDEIMAHLSGLAVYQADPDVWLSRALRHRNDLLRQVGTVRRHPRAWFIVSAPVRRDRRVWREQLRPERVVVLETPAAECVRRIAADPARAARVADQRHAVGQWWETYEPDEQHEVRVQWEPRP